MRVQTRHTPGFGVARVLLDPGESVQAAPDTLLASRFGVTEAPAGRGGVRASKSTTAVYTAPSGTVTRVATESFGGMSDEGGTAQIEVRASWTPCPAPDSPAGTPLDIASHVEAWGELLCTAVGLPPVPDGVTAMPSRRGQRGAGR